MLEVQNLHKSYVVGKDTYEVLKGVDFTIHKGEFVAGMGPSGSGKTTLLNCISCFIPYEKGKVLLNGKKLAQLKEEKMAEIRNQELGFVFQDFMLLDGLTVFENVCIPQVIEDAPYEKMEKKAKKLLKMFGIWEIADKYPAEISGGERQRTAVARALINSPLLILADEPTGNLDSKSSRAVIDSFLEAKASLKATIFMVTHDSFSASFCDRVILLKDGVVYKNMERNSSQHAFHDALLEELKQMNTLEEEEENNENFN